MSPSRLFLTAPRVALCFLVVIVGVLKKRLDIQERGEARGLEVTPQHIP